MTRPFTTNPCPPDFALRNMRTLYGKRGLASKLVRATGASETAIRTAIRVPAMMSKATYNNLAEYFGWEVWK